MFKYFLAISFAFLGVFFLHWAAGGDFERGANLVRLIIGGSLLSIVFCGLLEDDDDQ